MSFNQKYFGKLYLSHMSRCTEQLAFLYTIYENVEENEIYVSKQPFNMTLYIGMSMNRIMFCNLYSSSQITVFSMLLAY